MDESDKNSSKKKNKQQTSFLKNLITKTISSLENILNYSKGTPKKYLKDGKIVSGEKDAGRILESFISNNIYKFVDSLRTFLDK